MKIKLLKVSATLLVALFVCTKIMAQNVNIEKLSEQLELTIVGYDHEALGADKPLRLDITLKNSGKYPVAYIVPEVRTPLTISVWDTQGNNLNAHQSDNLKKDRSDAGREETLAPGETKTYRIYLLSLNLPEMKAANLELQLEATYPIVQYVNNEYLVTLIKSSRLPIRLNAVAEPKK